MTEIVELVKTFEGYRRRRYVDATGKLTIGYGDTELAKTRDAIEPDEAELVLRTKLRDLMERLQAHARARNARVPATIIEATASLAYNVGYARATSSSWWKSVLAGKPDVLQLLRWHRAGDKVLRGLLLRRIAEGLHALGKDWRGYTEYERVSRAFIQHDDKKLRKELLKQIANEIARANINGTPSTAR